MSASIEQRKRELMEHLFYLPKSYVPTPNDIIECALKIKRGAYQVHSFQDRSQVDEVGMMLDMFNKAKTDPKLEVLFK